MQRDERTLTLLLVRHGETQWNAENRWQGQRDIPLSDTGRQQAILLQQRLHNAWQHGILPVPHTLYSSDLSRAIETASVLQTALPCPVPHMQLSTIRERDFGSWEGLTHAEVKAQFGSALLPHDGESYISVWNRMQSALEQIWQAAFVAPEQTEDTVLVVGHGGSLRMLLARALGAGVDEARRFRLGNTSLSVVVFHGTEPTTAEGHLRLVNDTAHLEVAHLSDVPNQQPQEQYEGADGTGKREYPVTENP